MKKNCELETIMSDEVKLSIIWGTVLVACVLIISVTICAYHTIINKTFMEQGYVEAYDPGARRTVWTKAER